MEEVHQGELRVVRFPRSVKAWIASIPDVRDARPPITPCCGRASVPPDAPIVLHGHGLRERTVRGVLDDGQTPAFHALWVRRYRCTACGATCTVVPVDVLPRLRFGAVTLALALGFFGVLQRALHEIRAALNPVPQAGFDDRGWRSMRRWIAIVSALFPDVRPSPPDWTTHRIAERAATTLAARVVGATLTAATLPSLLVAAALHPP